MITAYDRLRYRWQTSTGVDGETVWVIIVIGRRWWPGRWWWKLSGRRVAFGEESRDVFDRKGGPYPRALDAELAALVALEEALK